MLTPIIALISWTLLIWMWMYATRLPAMQKAKIAPQDAQYPGSLNTLPAGVRNIADNYNHLCEQPTLFYALAFYSYLAGTSDPFNVALAWGYVGLRVAHSLVQCTVNIVMLRFATFSLSTILLVILAARNLLALG